MFTADAISQRLLVLAKMIERTTSRQLQSEFGISVAQWRVLAFICISGPATASFIGEAAEVDRAEISRAVKALMADGLAIREFEPGSRKTMIIAPTDRGKARFYDIRARRRGYFSSITRSLSAAERAAFTRAMDLIAQDVVNERAQGG